MILSDLSEMKKILEIDPLDTSEDSKLSFFAEWATGLIAEFLDFRDGFDLKSRVEYYDGTGTPLLRLKVRPVFPTPTIEVSVDEAGYYGEFSGAFSKPGSTLVYGTDFFLKAEYPDGSSRSGMLIRLNNFWPKRDARQRGLLSPFIVPGYGPIKVTYTAGYTTDTLPPQFRAACNLLVARLRFLFPLGMEIGSESYEERHISYLANRKDYLMSLVKPMLFSFKSWSF